METSLELVGEAEQVLVGAVVHLERAERGVDEGGELDRVGQRAAAQSPVQQGRDDLLLPVDAVEVGAGGGPGAGVGEGLDAVEGVGAGREHERGLGVVDRYGVQTETPPSESTTSMKPSTLTST